MNLPVNCGLMQFVGSTWPWTSGSEIRHRPTEDNVLRFKFDDKSRQMFWWQIPPFCLVYFIWKTFLKFWYEFHFRIFIYFQNSISFTIHTSLHYRETHWTEAHLWSIYRISYEPPDGSQIARTLYQNLSMRQRSIFFANFKEYQRYLNNHEWIHIQNTHTRIIFLSEKLWN